MPIISKNIRIRYPEHFKIGENSIIDDFCYFSTRVEIGDFSHIATGVSVAGGVRVLFKLGSFGGVSAGARIWCTTDDFVNDIVTVLPAWLEAGGPIKENQISGDVIMDDFTVVGSNAVVMPRNHIPEGTMIGALSFVPTDFDFQPWSVYAGIPVRFVKPRNKANVIRQFEKVQERLRHLEQSKETK
jgi:acetyltransferase-like isoleucine patch superfamily enzyme